MGQIYGLPPGLLDKFRFGLLNDVGVLYDLEAEQGNDPGGIDHAAEAQGVGREQGRILPAVAGAPMAKQAVEKEPPGTMCCTSPTSLEP